MTIPINREFFKHEKWWASTIFDGDEIWGRGETQEDARKNLLNVIAELKADLTSESDAVEEWIKLNTSN